MSRSLLAELDLLPWNERRGFIFLGPSFVHSFLYSVHELLGQIRIGGGIDEIRPQHIASLEIQTVHDNAVVFRSPLR